MNLSKQMNQMLELFEISLKTTVIKNISITEMTNSPEINEKLKISNRKEVIKRKIYHSQAKA